MSSDTPKKTKKQPSEIVIGVNGKPRPRPITHRELIFARAYGDPSSPTFANGTQSALKAAPNLAIQSAGVEGCRMLKRPIVSGTIVQILQSAGLGIEVRADELHKIISHQDIGETVSETTRKDGVVRTVTRTSPIKARDKLKAIDLANKMDGLYQQNQAAADVAVEEYRILSKRFFSPKGASDMPKSSPVARVVSPQRTRTPKLASEGTQGLEGAPQDAPAPGETGGGG